MASSTPQNGTPVSSTPASGSSSTPSVPLPPPRPESLGAQGAVATPPDNGASATENANSAPTTASDAWSKNIVSNGDLPWAVVLMPTTSSGVGGVGESKHHLQVGDWVFGFFADGDSCQQPVIVGVIPGGAGAGSGSFGGDGSSGAGGVNGDDIKATNIPQTEAQKIVYNKLKAIGFTHVQSVGIMGNIQQESGFKLSAAGDSGSAHGICQWRFDRWANLKTFAANKGKSYNDLETQVEFIKHEMEKYPAATGYAMTLLNTAKTAEEAARAFCNFEKPRGYHFYGPGRDGTAKADGIGNRIGAAKQFDKQFAGSGAPATLPKPAGA